MEIIIRYYHDVEKFLNAVDACVGRIDLQTENGDYQDVKNNAALVRYIYRSERKQVPLTLRIEKPEDLPIIIKYLNTAALTQQNVKKPTVSFIPKIALKKSKHNIKESFFQKIPSIRWNSIYR